MNPKFIVRWLLHPRSCLSGGKELEQSFANTPEKWETNVDPCMKVVEDDCQRQTDENAGAGARSFGKVGADVG